MRFLEDEVWPNLPEETRGRRVSRAERRRSWVSARMARDPRNEAEVEVLPFETEHWGAALEAFERFGKGRHPAALNFGDCLAYATARVRRQPLLCDGDDFSRTDLEIVPLP